MRRSRFAKAIEVTEVRERASIRDALLFDVTNPDSSAEESLCEWRLSAMQHAPVVLGITHLLIAATCICLSTSFHYGSLSDNPVLISAIVLAVDFTWELLSGDER